MDCGAWGKVFPLIGPLFCHPHRAGQVSPPGTRHKPSYVDKTRFSAKELGPDKTLILSQPPALLRPRVAPRNAEGLTSGSKVEGPGETRPQRTGEPLARQGGGSASLGLLRRMRRELKPQEKPLDSGCVSICTCEGLMAGTFWYSTTLSHLSEGAEYGHPTCEVLGDAWKPLPLCRRGSL